MAVRLPDAARRRRLATLLGTSADWRKDPLCRRRYADELVAQVCGRGEGTATDVDEALSCLRELPAALPYLSTRSLWKVIPSPELVTAPAGHRAAFWGQAELLFHDNPDLAWLAACNLSHALGLDGTGELETALAALDRCYASSPGGRGERRSYEAKHNHLAWLIANRRVAASVRLTRVAPAPPGSASTGFVASLVGADETVDRLLKQSPLAYVDLYRGTALNATCAVSVRPQRRGADHHAVLLLPSDPGCPASEGTTGLRARLLFLGSEDDGFRGTVDSGVIPVATDGSPAGPS